MKKTSILFTLLLLTTPFSSSKAMGSAIDPPNGLIPVNPGEAMVVAFFEPHYFPINQWAIGPGEGKDKGAQENQGLNYAEIDVEGSEHGLSVIQNALVGAMYQWLRKPADGVGITMEKAVLATVEGYENLIVTAMLPETASLEVTLQTDQGEVKKRFERLEGYQREYILPLNGITQLKRIKLAVLCDAPESQSGRFLWIGVQHEGRLQAYLNNLNPFGSEWKYHLKKDYEPTFQPKYDIVISGEDLASLRESHQQFVDENGTSPLLEAARQAMETPPETLIGDSMGNNIRFARDRDLNRNLSTHASALALAALVTRDADMLRMAARYALSMGMTPHWDESFFAHFPGTAWDHRAFRENSTANDVAVILDLAGEMFTDVGVEFLQKRMAKEAIGFINFNTWKYEYIHHMNQLAAFSDGRILSYAILEKTMPRVAPYLEIAYEELAASFEEIILPDGGYVEGPNYLAYTVLKGGQAFYYYARARGKKLGEVMPENVKNTTAFAEAVSSTVEGQDVIPICDAKPKLGTFPLSILAATEPNSQWTALYQQAKEREGGMPNKLLSLILDQRIPEEVPSPKAFVHLPDMGVMASTRYLKGEPLKILIMGNQKGAGHTHEDKGSFVLEFAGEAFAMDMGTPNYGDPLTFIAKQCQRHNMLVPIDDATRPAPLNPIPYNVKPEGKGDEKAFEASVDATPGWGDYYEKWLRRWSSPSPDELIITDDYALKKGEGAEFYWLTTLPVTIRGKKVVIDGKRGRAEMRIPAGCTARVDTLPLPHGETQNRLVFTNPKTSDVMEVRVKFKVKG